VVVPRVAMRYLGSPEKEMIIFGFFVWQYLSKSASISSSTRHRSRWADSKVPVHGAFDQRLHALPCRVSAAPRMGCRPPKERCHISTMWSALAASNASRAGGRRGLFFALTYSRACAWASEVYIVSGQSDICFCCLVFISPLLLPEWY